MPFSRYRERFHSLDLTKAVLINTVHGDINIYQCNSSALYYGVYNGVTVTQGYTSVREAGRALRMFTEGEF